MMMHYIIHAYTQAPVSYQVALLLFLLLLLAAAGGGGGVSWVVGSSGVLSVCCCCCACLCLLFVCMNSTSNKRAGNISLTDKQYEVRSMFSCSVAHLLTPLTLLCDTEYMKRNCSVVCTAADGELIFNLIIREPQGSNKLEAKLTENYSNYLLLLYVHTQQSAVIYIRCHRPETNSDAKNCWLGGGTSRHHITPVCYIHVYMI